MNKKGIVLIGVIIIIVALSIVALGITIYISEALRANVGNINQTKALYMAQTGIMRAIVDYRDGGSWNPAQNVNVEGGFYYHLGKNANFLLVDASAPKISGKKLIKIPIQNINASSSITITDMIVSWGFGGSLVGVKLGNTLVWSGTASSPASLNVTDLTIASGTSYSGYNDQEWEFSTASIIGDVVCTFILSDGSQIKSYLIKNDLSGSKEFSITATGEVRSGTAVQARRTLNATYDIGTSKITSWQESQNHINP